MDQQVVLGEEASEQQPVPLLVGALGDEQVELVALVAELAGLGSQPAAELALVFVEMRWGAVCRDGQRCQRRADGLLGCAPALGAGVLESLPLLGGEYGHRSCPQMMMVSPSVTCWISMLVEASSR